MKKAVYALFLVLAYFLLTTPASGGEATERYLALFSSGTDLSDTRQKIEQDIKEDIRFTYRHLIKGFSLSLTKKEALGLRSLDSLKLLSLDTEVQGSAFRKTALWNLDRVDQRNRTLDGVISTQYSGLGVKIYLVDSGVNANHIDFSNRVVAGYSAVNDGWGEQDCYGHGTQVAAVAAGETYGVAPGATVVPVRVLDCYNQAYWSEVLAGLDWIGANHLPGEKAVVNLSLSGRKNPVVNLAVRRLVEMGVVVTTAAGNNFESSCKATPASSSLAITVGASDRQDRQSWYSNFGPCIDIFAPGNSIVSARHNSLDGFSRKSGTSLASPHVAGAAALLLEGGDLSAAEIASLLSRKSSKNKIGAIGFGTSNRLLFVN